MSRFLVCTIVFFSAGALSLLPLSSRAEQVDQQYDPPAGQALSGSDAQEIGQTFTVGIAGTLTRVEVKLFKIFAAFDSAVLTLYNTSGGFPATALDSVNIHQSAIPFNTPTYISFDFADTPVSVGNVLAVGLRSSAGGTYFWAADPNGTYAGGKGVRRTLNVPPDPWENANPNPGFDYDFGFKTYVEPSVVSIDGDLDDDNDVDSQDIDILWNVIRPEIAGSDDPNADDDEDLNGDGFVNEDDVDYMLANLLDAGTNRQYGDADLDGGVGGLDYTAWRQRAGTGWANGDFDGDGGVGGLDYTLWRTRPTAYPTTVGPHPGSISPVPEPATWVLALLGVLAMGATRMGR